MVAGAAFESAAFGYEPKKLPHTLPCYKKNESVGEGRMTPLCGLSHPSLTVKNECVTFYPKVKKKFGFPFNSKPEISRRVSFLLLPSLSLIYLLCLASRPFGGWRSSLSLSLTTTTCTTDVFLSCEHLGFTKNEAYLSASDCRKNGLSQRTMTTLSGVYIPSSPKPLVFRAKSSTDGV